MMVTGFAVSEPPAIAQAQQQYVPDAGRAMDVGLILTDRNLRPIYADDYSVRLLTDPGATEAASVIEMQRRLQALVGASIYPADPVPPIPFMSGRRQCLCRSFLLHYRLEGEGAPAVGILLEPQDRMWSAVVCDASRRFRLSPREVETVQHLVCGLTTKEIAPRMGISPNTVKQFVRSIMSKMGTTTRAGVLGKIFST
jgi:DNA-binding CsgD family transcriptional regulator